MPFGIQWESDMDPKPMKPQNDSNSNRSYINVDPIIRSLSSMHLIRWALLSPDNPNQAQFIREIETRLEMRRGISEFDSFTSDPCQDPLSPANIPGCELVVRRFTPLPPSTPEQRKTYGEDEVATDRNLRWYVGCLRPKPPGFGLLPAMFPTAGDALRACSRLMEAGLKTDEALTKRIKVDLDWPGVRRIMLGEPDAS